MQMTNPFQIIDQRLTFLSELMREIRFENQAADIKYVSIKKAAELFDVSRPVIYEMIKEGIIKKYRIKGIPRVKVSELIEAVKVSS